MASISTFVGRIICLLIRLHVGWCYVFPHGQPGKIYTSHIKIQKKIYSSIIEVYELSILTTQYVLLSKIFFCVKIGKVENHWRFSRLSPLLKIKPLCRCFHFFMVSAFSASFYFLGRGRGGGAGQFIMFSWEILQLGWK